MFLTSVAGWLLGMAAIVLVLETGVRLYRWRFAPLRLRMLYAAFLLSGEAVQAIAQIHQRVERAAVRSFHELFQLYAAASGKSVADIDERVGFSMRWRQLNTAALTLKNQLRWHVGLVPVPGQRLRTASITTVGTRSNGLDDAMVAGPSATINCKRVLVVGGSVAYGQGATSDETAIGARLREHLNRGNVGSRWEVVNRGLPGGATSFQELIVALQCDDETPDYLVSISGWNDVDQQFGSGEPNVSVLAEGYTTSLERRTSWKEPARIMARRVVLLAALRRAVTAYREWPGPHAVHGYQGTTARRESDQPDIYPLW